MRKIELPSHHGILQSRDRSATQPGQGCCSDGIVAAFFRRMPVSLPCCPACPVLVYRNATPPGSRNGDGFEPVQIPSSSIDNHLMSTPTLQSWLISLLTSLAWRPGRVCHQPCLAAYGVAGTKVFSIKFGRCKKMLL
ncbi:hypothetical protein VTN96DRAFT_3543 [Rasamsonia emersonii]